MLAHRADNGGQKARRTGESAIYAVKPSRGECRDVSAEPVVTAASFSFCWRAMGAASSRHSPCPLLSRRATFSAKLGRIKPRDCEPMAIPKQARRLRSWSSSAKADDPVRRGVSVNNDGLLNTGSPAFAGDDSEETDSYPKFCERWSTLKHSAPQPHCARRESDSQCTATHCSDVR